MSLTAVEQASGAGTAVALGRCAGVDAVVLDPASSQRRLDARDDREYDDCRQRRPPSTSSRPRAAGPAPRSGSGSASGSSTTSRSLSLRAGDSTLRSSEPTVLVVGLHRAGQRTTELVHVAAERAEPLVQLLAEVEDLAARCRPAPAAARCRRPCAGTRSAWSAWRCAPASRRRSRAGSGRCRARRPGRRRPARTARRTPASGRTAPSRPSRPAGRRAGAGAGRGRPAARRGRRRRSPRTPRGTPTASPSSRRRCSCRRPAARSGPGRSVPSPVVTDCLLGEVAAVGHAGELDASLAAAARPSDPGPAACAAR